MLVRLVFFRWSHDVEGHYVGGDRLRAAIRRRAAAAAESAARDTAEDCLALANVMAQALDPIRVHLDKVCSYLPSLLVQCDAQVSCPEAGGLPLWLKAHERRYRAVLSGVQPATSEIRMMRELLLRVHGVEARLGSRTDYGSTSMLSLAGVVVNPVFLISAGVRAYSANRTAMRQNEEQKEAARHLVLRAVGQWNYLLLQSLPALAHYILDGVFPIRLQFYQRIRRQLESAAPPERDVLAARLARRLATLVTFLQYPTTRTSGITPGTVASVTHQLRDRLTYSGFQTF